MGREPIFCLWREREGGGGKMGGVEQVLESTVGALGFELVDCELGQRGRFLRVFIDRPQPGSASITLEDCELVTRQLQRVLPVEGIDYDRLEVSSPGLDRVLRKPEHFRRFAGAAPSVFFGAGPELARAFSGGEAAE